MKQLCMQRRFQTPTPARCCCLTWLCNIGVGQLQLSLFVCVHAGRYVVVLGSPAIIVVVALIVVFLLPNGDLKVSVTVGSIQQAP